MSDDDYFTDDGVLDPGKVVSPRHSVSHDGAALRSPTNALNARLTGAAPPPTLGEIESHLNDSRGGEGDAASMPPTDMASPGGRSTMSTASGSNRTRPMPENGMGGNGGGGGRSHRKPGKKLGRGFFDESFDDAFPADNLDAFNSSVDRGTSSSPMAADRSNVVDSNQMADDPPLDIVDADDSSDEENNLVDGANKLASAMMELLGTEDSDNTGSGAKQQTKARAVAAGADPFEFAPLGGGQSGTTRSARGAVDAPDDEPPSLRPATPPPAVDAKPQDAVEAMRSPSPGPSVAEFIDLGDPSLSAKPSFTDRFAQRGMDRRSSAQRFAAAASNGGNDIYQPSLTSSRSISSNSLGGAGSHRRTLSGRGLRTLSSKKAEKPQSILKNSTMSPPRTKAPPVQKATQPDFVSMMQLHFIASPSFLGFSSLISSFLFSAHVQNDPNLDPIQRAGIRLLSAAAIPIQTEVRRYLAQRRTLAMFRALVRIQCFVRRWRAERHLRTHVESATQIQAAFRGWIARDTLEDEHYCATQMQRIVRGHIASIRVYKMLDDLRRHRQATVIQTAWRTYSAQLSYQFDIVDIIIVQSIARRKAAYREAARLNDGRWLPLRSRLLGVHMIAP